MPFISNNNLNIDQLIDANLDRAREGLRVIEDWCRFVIKRKDLVIMLKDFRHQLGGQHKRKYKKARSITSDPGKGLNHPSQLDRDSSIQIVLANFARVQEALRVLEEFSRGGNNQLSTISSKIRYEIYEIEKEVLITSEKYELKSLLKKSKLCLITRHDANLIEIVSHAVKAGVTMVQFRSKEDEDSKKIEQAKELANICKEHNALFIVNDRVDIAIEVDADGVHLGQEDFPLASARNLLGKDKLIGLSTHSIAQIKEATRQGCDYIGIGPVFTTNSKPNKKPIGLKLLKEAAKETYLPCFAIGGINNQNIDDVLANGVNRVAVIDAIMNSTDSSNASKQLLEKLL